MSYDIDFVLDAGGPTLAVLPTETCLNYTYNCGEMFRDTLKFEEINSNGIKGLNNRLAGDCIALLEKAVQRMKDNPGYYRSMNPPNGWGDAEGARRFLADILHECKRYPKATVRVS